MCVASPVLTLSAPVLTLRCLSLQLCDCKKNVFISKGSKPLGETLQQNTCFRGSKVLEILSGALTVAKGKFSSVTRTSTTQSTNHLPSPHSVPCIARALGEVGDVALRPAAGL